MKRITIKWQIGVPAICTLLTIHLVSADIVWPADNDWVALTLGASTYSDTEGDQSPSSTDLIGTTNSYSAGFWVLVEDGYFNAPTTDDAFMIRMRVGGNGGNYTWQAHLETDGDLTNIEWIFQLVQSGNPSNQGVELIKTAIGGSTLDAISTGSNSASWLGATSMFARWTPIPSTTHYHVDFAIPWSEFTNTTGVATLDDIRIILSTSTSHAGINKDAPLGSNLTEQISNVLSESIPEPAVVTLLLGAGGGIIAFRRIFSAEPDDERNS